MTMTIPESFEQKVSRLRVLMTEIGAGPFLADHGELMAWLTGYTVSETMYRAMLVGCDEAPWMVLSAEGIGISGTVLVTENGGECPTRTPRRMLVSQAPVSA